MPRTLLALLAPLGLLLALAPAAQAARTCAGTIRTGLLHPLPRPLTITASRGLQDTANPALTQSFVDGLRRAGQVPDKRGNVSLSISTEVISPSGKHLSPRNGGTAHFSNFDWMTGDPSVPGRSSRAARRGADHERPADGPEDRDDLLARQHQMHGEHGRPERARRGDRRDRRPHRSVRTSSSARFSA